MKSGGAFFKWKLNVCNNNRLAQEKSDVSPFLSFDTRMGQIAKFIQFVQIQGFP